MDSWPALLAEKSVSLRKQGAGAASAWLDEEQVKVSTGRLLLGYVGRVMEGEMTTDMDEWRDLFAQTYQLMYLLAPAVVGLERGLRAVRVEFGYWALS